MVKLELYCGDRIIGKTRYDNTIKTLHISNTEPAETGDEITDIITKKIFEYYTMDDLIKMTEVLDDDDKVVLFYAIFDEVSTNRHIIAVKRKDEMIYVNAHNVNEFIINEVSTSLADSGGYIGGVWMPLYRISEVDKQKWVITNNTERLKITYSKKENTIEVEDNMLESTNVETKAELCRSINKLLKTLDALNRRKLALDENNNIIVFK